MWCIRSTICTIVYGARHHALMRTLFLVLLLTQFVLANDTDNKYFHEPGEDDLHRHYDTRFFTDLVSDEERQLTLRAIIRAYLLLLENFQLETWIAHGTLLGWYWNGSILPWVSFKLLATVVVLKTDRIRL